MQNSKQIAIVSFAIVTALRQGFSLGYCGQFLEDGDGDGEARGGGGHAQGGLGEFWMDLSF